MTKDHMDLWILAGGRCSYPNCNEELVLIENGNSYHLGEMAHIIARKAKGPRGSKNEEDNSYSNLILLCPTHHTHIDKVPEKYPVEQLKRWKSEHEQRVREKLATPSFASKQEIFDYIRPILSSNKSDWQQFGPESEIAKQIPLSNVASHWAKLKLTNIVPRNRRMITLITENLKLLSPHQIHVFSAFRTHAEGFEQSCYDRLDYVPRFPPEFEEMINGTK